nr:MAG TPA: minor tail protein [Caudoviricetes sp.]
MANKLIRGLTVEIGGDTTKLGEALKNVESKSKGLSGELAQVNKLLKLDPTNTELLGQKQKVLAGLIEATSEKLGKLRSAEAAAFKGVKNWDAYTKAVAPIEAQIDKVTESLRKMKIQQEEAQEDFGVDSDQYMAASARVEEVSKQLKALREQARSVREEFDNPISPEAHRALQREIAATENALKDYEDAAKDTDDALKNLGKGAKTAEQRTQELAERSGVAAKDLDKLKEKADDVADKGLKVLAAAATATVAALTAASEATREYRTNMAKLNVAFTDNGHSAAEAQEAYQELVGVLGESDQAVEAANHLAKLTDNARDLATWTGDILPGVFATFGDSLPIEGLTEAANETAKVGQVTGPLADALNWAGVSEDKFNESLAACSDEQERQALITGTLSRLYKGAADQYKKTNAEVIRANKANDAWTASLAKTGKTMEPIVTDVKELGVELLQSAEQPVQRLTKYIRSTLLPTLEKVSKWALKNGPQLIGVATGLTTAMAAYKTGALAAKVVTSDLTKVVLGAEKAQKLLNLAQAATPWGLAVAGAAAVVAGLAALSAAQMRANESTSALTAEEQSLCDSAREAASAFETQRAAVQESMSGIESQFDRTEELASELLRLAGASGQVAESDQARAAVILGELNDALGTEYKMINGQIQAYSDLRDSVEDLIAAKRAEAMLSVNEDAYKTALANHKALYEAMTLAEKDYQAQMQETEAARERNLDAMANGDLQQQINAAATLREMQRIEEQKRQAWLQSVADFGACKAEESKYQAASAAAYRRDYERVEQILDDAGYAHEELADIIKDSLDKSSSKLANSAVEAAVYAKYLRTNFENGVAGFTEPMVQEAEETAAELWKQLSNTPDKALKFGQDVGDGMVKGMESKRKSVYDTAESIANGMFRRLRAVTQTHSPSRRMEGVFRDIWAGAEVGTEKSEKPILAHTQDLAEKLLNIDAAARMPALALQRITQQDQAARVAAYQAAFAVPGTPLGDLSAKLDLILAAIDRGQIIALDGDQIVGGTVDRVNARLGLISTENSRNVR